MSSLDEILNKINKAKSIVILAHENPDGDAIGSALAMYFALKNIEKDVEVVMPKYPKTYSALPGTEFLLEEGTKEKYDLAISVDCATIKLLNGWSNYFEDAKDRIVIDHHSTNSMYGDINYVDLTAPACCQVIYVMFNYYKWEITPEIGTCLMNGIITDTGGFQYSGVSKETFEISADLITKGVNISKIYKQAMDTHSRASFELKKIALERMEFLCDGKVTFTYINKKDENKAKAENGDTEGIVNEGRGIEGVEVSVFLREADNGYKVSMRSNDYVNVSDICLIFGGGGHPKAAGATMQGTPKQIKKLLLNEIQRVLK